ncbi:MAG TPA: lysine--tRNA ligase [Candidatus Saccharimonadales bacterium]|nr:lysine--tRNA ligase [Candidatus Saccharimonadales bacterium]
MENKSEKKIRAEKLAGLKKLGINPYPAAIPPFVSVEEARTKKEGATVSIVGRITGLREHGKSAFLDVTFDDDKLQSYFKLDELGEEKFNLLKFFDVGDYIWVEGELFTTHAGETTIKVKDFQMLSKTLLPIPDEWQGLSDIETRYRSRALDFKINPEAKKTIRARSLLIKTLREFLDRHGFTEIQTPILQPIPGGAAAKPFITHYNIIDADFYLRVSPELYLKRLIVGGFDRVYEIGPCFRNEGLSHMHNPEFTMCEFYWAYQTHHKLMEVTQQMMAELAKKICGSTKITYQRQKIDFGGQYPVKKFAELIKEKTGIDINQHRTLSDLEKAVKEANVTLEGEKATVWSQLVDELFKKTVRPTIIEPTFIIEYPLELTPLAKKNQENDQLAERFQLIAAGGFELVNAYTELNDPVDQEERFRAQAKMKEAGWDESQLLDENFIEALKFGMPPTAGWGLGVDRLAMILTDNYSIKEVIPFPTLKPLK